MSKDTSTPKTESKLSLDRSSTVVAVLGDARVELRHAVDGGIDLAEKLANGTFRFARKLTQRLDDASSNALGGVDRAFDNAVLRAQDTSRAVRELAATALVRRQAA